MFGKAQSFSTNVKVKHFSTNEGLLQNTVRSILKDDDGFVWICTNEGIQKFDGKRFYKISTSNKEGFLLNDKQSYLFKDVYGNVWIMHNRGLSCFLRNKGSFKNIVVFSSPATENLLEGFEYVGADAKGNVWLYRKSNGFYYLHTKDQQIECTNNKIAGVSINFSEKFFIVPQPDESSIIYTGTEFYHFRFKENKVVVKNNIPLTENTIVYSLGDKYLCTQSAPMCTPFTFDTSGKVKQPLPFQLTFGLLKVFPMSKYTTLCFMYNQLFYYDVAAKKFSSPISDETGLPFIVTGHVNTIYCDSEGVCWVGTNTQGIFCFRASGPSFNLIRTSEQDLNFVRGLWYDDMYNRLWSGTYENGFVVFDSSGKKLKQIPASFLTGVKESKKGVNAFAPFNKQKVIVWGEYAEPLFVNRNTFIPLSKVRMFIPDSLKKIYSINNQRFYFDKVVLLNDDDYWVQYRHSVMLFQKKNDGLLLKKVVALNQENNEALCSEGNKKLWWGNRNSVYQYTIETGATELFVTFKDKLVKSILPLPNGVWIGTDNGLFYYSKKGVLLKKIAVENGLPDQYVYSIMQDKNGLIWCSTNNGLFSFNVSAEKINTFSDDDGLQGKEFNTNAYLQLRNGNMYWGGVNGINSINPAKLQQPVYTKPVITSIKSGDSVLLDPVFYKPLNSLQLPHYLSDITVEFGNHGYETSADYSYRLTGLHSEWQYASTNSDLHFILSPSKYVLEIKYGHPEDHTPVTRLELTILKPWYLSSLSIIVYLLLLTVSVAALVYYFDRRKQKKLESELESVKKIQSERERISRDLHDNVGSQVTYMLMNLEGVNGNESIENVKTVSRSIMDSLRETIWALNENPVTAIDFSDKLKTYCKKYVPVECVFNEDIQEIKQLPKEKILHLFRLCQEALNNAAKHSEADLLSITVLSNKEKPLSVTIADNGKGFDLEEKTETEDHYGLKNMQYRAMQSGATCNIISSPGKGTQVVVELQ